MLRRSGVRYRDPGEWRRKRKALYVLDDPGREVQVDACFPFGRARRDVQYDAVDDCTRLAFSRVHTEHSVRSSAEFVANLVRESPFRISRIRTDCGMEFGPGFTAFLERMGIAHVRTAPYSPQHNGKVERYHRTLWQRVGKPSPRTDVHEYRYRLRMFQDWYNFRKPHSGLGMGGLTPAQKMAYCLVHKSF